MVHDPLHPRLEASSLSWEPNLLAGLDLGVLFQLSALESFIMSYTTSSLPFTTGTASCYLIICICDFLRSRRTYNEHRIGKGKPCRPCSTICLQSVVIVYFFLFIRHPIV
ncbi:hypothetical protein BDV11DRAFT_4375 [Aspergillus similis]